MRCGVRVQALVATSVITLLALSIAHEASAQITYPAGASVQASPTQMNGYWQDCVVVSGPDSHQTYRVRCDGGSEMSVPAKWIRPGGGPKGAPKGAGGGGSLTPPPAPTPATPVATPRPSAPAPPPPPQPKPQPKPQQGASGSVALGSYECWAWGRPRMLLNFTVTGPSRYTASDDSVGTFTFDPGSKAIRFTGYLADSLPKGFTTIYYEPRGLPTVSFRGPGGSEASFCERAR